MWFFHWKNKSLTRWTFVGKVVSLLFNMLSRLVINFLPRRKHLLISWLQSPFAVILNFSDFEFEVVLFKFTVIENQNLECYFPLSDIMVSKNDIFVIGNEGHGISPEISAECSGSVYIPISSKAESLNASVAAAVFMWEQNKN